MLSHSQSPTTMIISTWHSQVNYCDLGLTPILTSELYRCDVCPSHLTGQLCGHKPVPYLCFYFTYKELDNTVLVWTQAKTNSPLNERCQQPNLVHCSRTSRKATYLPEKYKYITISGLIRSELNVATEWVRVREASGSDSVSLDFSYVSCPFRKMSV